MGIPAGFWRRYAAYSLDLLLLAPLWALALWAPLDAAYRQWLTDLAGVQLRLLELMQPAYLLGMDRAGLPAASWVHDPALRGALLKMLEHASAASLDLVLRCGGLGALYFIGFEASPWQASPGKRWLGLRVTDGQGARPGALRVVVRVLAGSLSWASLNLGHALAAWTPNKQALHDLVAGTQVLCVSAAPWPRWARAWLAAQAGLLLGLVVLVGYRYVQALQLALASGLL